MHQVAHEPAEALANDSAHPLRALNSTPVPPPRYTSRIQKGGALLQEMRLLVQIWTDASLETNRAEVILRNPLNKATRARVADVINRIFVPRFVDGPIKNGWKLLLPLERLGASASMVRPIYYWFTALAEPIAYDFCCEYLSAQRSNGVRAIDVKAAASWICSRNLNWSETVTIKVTRALLAAFRDFGVLDGKAKKWIASPHLPTPAFAYIAFCMHHSLGVAARNILAHPDWRLFMLTPADVERLLLEAHQQRFLEYHAAGSVIRLSFPVATAEQYAHVVLGR